MDKKQQFIEKCLKKILTSKFIIALALELPAEVYDDFIKEIAKVIHFQLSECWDMAGEEGENKIINRLKGLGSDAGDVCMNTEGADKNACETANFISWIINSLTSQKEGKKG